MALQKAIPTQYGIDANYWRIAEKREVFVEGNIATQVILFAYVSQEARDDGKRPLQESASVTIAGESYTPDMTRQDIYEYMKTLPEFADAVDV